MLLWLVYALFFLPALLKQNLLWLYLWQSREYRFDKMMDYLSLAESKKVLFDNWSRIRLVVLVANIALILFSVPYYFQIAAIVLILALFAVECVNYINKVLSKKIKLPAKSAKAGLLFLLSFISIIILPIFLFYYLTDVDLQLSVLNLLSLILWTNLILLFTPLIVGYWILMIFPFDLYTKNKLFKKAELYRKTLNKLKVIAISGAFGKTTTKEILETALSSKYRVEKTIKNQNSNVSCARRTLNLNTDTEIFICELGAYKRGDGNEICKFIQPTSSIITGLNHQHFSLFGSEANIILAESESLKFLAPGDLAIVNWSSALCHKIEFPENINVIKCGILGENIPNPNEVQYLASNLITTFEGTSFDLRIHKYPNAFRFNTNLISKGAVQNILHVLALCLEHELMDIPELQQLIQNLPQIEGRMQIYPKSWGKLVYNQYNNPDGVANALALLGQYPNRKIAILDDILELGGKSTTVHTQVAAQLFKSKPDLVILLGRNFSSQIKSDLLQKGYPENQILVSVGKNYTKIQSELQKLELNQTNLLILLMGYQTKEFLDL